MNIIINRINKNINNIKNELIIIKRLAHHQTGGKTTNGRDSCGKRLGVKKFGGYIIFII